VPRTVSTQNGFGAKPPSQRADHDIDDVASRWASVAPHGFHEVVTADGFLTILTTPKKLVSN